jgi:hypothetical protein
MLPFISLPKSGPLSVVNRAAAGEENVIAGRGLGPVVSRGHRRSAANAMRIEYVAPDFDAPDSEIERLFVGDPT